VITESEALAVFGKHLKSLREKRFKSRRVAANECGIPPSTFARYENGENLPDLYTLLVIIKIFEIDQELLFLPFSDLVKNDQEFWDLCDTAMKIKKNKKLWAELKSMVRYLTSMTPFKKETMGGEVDECKKPETHIKLTNDGENR